MGADSERSPLRDVAYGSFAGALSKLFEHPFDLVKVRLQSQSPHEPLRFHGPLDCFKQTFMKEGMSGLYRGLSMPIFGAMAENASLFLVYNRVKSLIRSLDGTTKPGEMMPLSQLAIAAGCAGAVTSFVLTPIELVKCRMQVQQLAPSIQISSIASSAATPPLEAAVLSSSSPSHSISSRIPKTTASTLSSRFSSTFTTTTTAAKKLPGPLGIVSDIIKTEGIRGLWLGQTGTLLRETGGSPAWFLAFEAVSAAFLKRRQQNIDDSSIGDPIQISRSDLPAWNLMLAGACAGVSYNVVLYPADSIKSTMQTEKELGRSQTPRGFLEVGREIYRGRGIRGLYSGCGLTCLRSGPGSAMIFLIFSLCERYFG